MQHSVYFETTDSGIPLTDEFSAFQDVYVPFLVLPDPQGKTGLTVLLLMFAFRHLVTIR